MKRCSYCGKKHDDDATVCVIDREPLVQVILKSQGRDIDGRAGSLMCDIGPVPMCKWIEFENVRQIPGEPRRRWFTCDESGGPTGFQLCYKNEGSEYALTWKSDCGFSHKRIDDGEEGPGKHKATPILTADAPASTKLISERLAQVSAGLPVQFAEFVEKKLRESGKACC